MSKWTKKDYIQTAKILSDIKDKTSRQKATGDFIVAYKKDNPNFDELVFVDAIERKTPSEQTLTSSQKRRINEFIRKTEDEKLKKELR